MAYITAHGGHCCGIRHMYSFGYLDTKESIQKLIDTETAQHRTQGYLVEAVITNAQCRLLPNLAKNLQEVGFRLVSRFKNPNSSNICNVFHYNVAPRSLTTRLPFKLIKD